jgi:polysaccharide biosynthesis transport protein
MMSNLSVPVNPYPPVSPVPEAAASAHEDYVSLPAPAEPRSVPGRGIKPLVSLRAHRRLALSVMLLVALVGLPVAWIKGQAIYQSTAVLHVSPRFLSNLQQDQEFELQSNSQYREFVQHQVRTINRYEIVRDALQNLGERRFLWQRPEEGERRAVERLQAALQIQSVPDTYLITVSLEEVKPDGLAEIVNAVVETYLKQEKEEEFYASDQRLANLTTERTRLLGEIQTLSAQRTELVQELGATTFTPNNPSPYDQLLVSSKEALATARRRRIEAEAQLAAFDPAQKNGEKALDAAAQDLMAKDTGLSTLKANLYKRRGELLSQISGLAPDHVGRKAAERESQEIDTELNRVSKELFDSFRTLLLEQRKTAVRETRRTEQDLDAEVEKTSANATWYATRYGKALAVDIDIDHLRKRLDAIEDRVSFISLEKQAPGFVRLVSPARPPEIPVKGGRKKFFALFVVAAVCLGLAAPVAVDFLDPRIHAADELDNLLGFAPMGWLPDRTDPRTQPFVHDQLLRLAGNLDRERRTHGTRMFVFSAVRPGGGTTTLVLDLARTLTDLGIPTLAVEVNAFKPDERYTDDLARPPLAAVLNDYIAIDKAIVPGTETLPDRVAVGAANSTRHLEALHQLKVTLSPLSSRYELFLLDAPPLLLSADTELLVGIIDAAVLVVEACGVSKGEVTRAARTLERLAPTVVGTILNRVQMYQGGGYFAELLQEHQSGQKVAVSRWLSPWLWR